MIYGRTVPNALRITANPDEAAQRYSLATPGLPPLLPP